MKCTACSRSNLPGGVRCVYCGVHFPKHLDFQLTTPPQPAADTDPAADEAAPRARKRGLAGGLAVLALKAKSILVLFKFGKLALTFGSMFVYIAVYSRIFGWSFAAGLAVCIFIHEMGHVTVNWMKGIKATAPMFIPFVGAVIFLKNFPEDPQLQSESGAGGPAAGMLAALACYLIGLASGNPFWFALASLGAFINLFNMVPFPPLDGSHISTVFAPRVWTAVLVTILLIAIKVGFTGSMGHFSVVLLFIVVVGFVFRLGRTADTRHLLAAPGVRIRMALVFIGLCIGLSAIGAASGAALARAQSSIHPDNVSARLLSDYTDQAQEVDQTTAAHERRLNDVLTNTGSMMIAGLALGLASAFWCFSGFLLNRAAGKSAWLTAVPVGMVLLFAALFTAVIASNSKVSTATELLTSVLVASGAALAYSIYAVVHQTIVGFAGSTLLMSHALAWAAGAALISAYAMDSGTVVLLVTTTALVYFIAVRWVAQLLAAQLYTGIGRTSRAIRWYTTAVASNPPLDAKLVIYSQLISLELRLSHGTQAMSTIAIVDELKPAGRHSIQELSLRSSALMLQDRFNESLDCVERILAINADDPAIYSRLQIAHIRLAEMTRLRGWYDECVSQIERALLKTTKSDRTRLAALLVMRGQALLAAGDANAARRDLAAGLKISKEAAIRERAAVLQSAISLADGDHGAALKNIEIAAREAEEDLEIQFCHIQALRACGNTSAAIQTLKELATSYPQEHWGRLAQALLIE